MYKLFKARNFRCFRDLTINNLERVNLIAGINNVGKTALLEALFLHCGAFNPGLTFKLNVFRGIGSVKIELGQWAETPWDSLFRGFDISKSIDLIGEDTVTGHRALRLEIVHQPEELAKISHAIRYSPEKSESASPSSEVAQVLGLEYKEGEKKGKYYLILDSKGPRPEPVPPPPPFPGYFQGARAPISFREQAELFGRLEVRGKQDIVSQVLKLIEPRLKRLAVVVVAGEPILHGDIGIGHLMPLPMMGGGMVRLASLAVHIGNAPNGVVLVDEIENGLHHSVLPKVWRAIGEMAREFNTQIFATTHSLECVIAAHKAFSESEHYDFRLHRLEHIKEAIRAITYDQETLEAAIESGLEVR